MRYGAVTAAALLLALEAPAAAQSGTDYDRGVSARLEGNTDVAIELLGRAVANEPANADAQLQYGLALLAAGRLNEAERAFLRTLELAPNYDDARIALARVHQRRGDRQAALAELARVAAANPEAGELRTALLNQRAPEGHFRWRVDLDGSYSNVRGESDWRDISLRVAGAGSASTQLGAAIEHSHRFGRNDTYGEVRVDHRASDRTVLWLLAGGTPSADFRPRWQLGAGGAFKLTRGPTATVATIEARHSRYPTGDIQSVNPGVEQYLPGGHWVTARMINVAADGDVRSGWLTRVDAMAGRRLRLFAGIADAPDITEGVVVNTFSMFGGVVADLNDRTVLRLSVNNENRRGTVDRLEIAAGIGVRF